MEIHLSVGTRIRKSPYFEATLAAGASHFSAYNHMYMPVAYGDSAAEYRRLIAAVSLWDVACQRQIELAGPDADRLAQTVSARNLTGTQIGQGRYVPMVDHSGRLINDPLVLKVADDIWWFSIADGDILQWCRAIAAERNLDVVVNEADVAPLAVQGPRAADVLDDLLGVWVRDLKFFRFTPTELNGIRFLLGRAGWSKQGGYELYLLDTDRGAELWDLIMEAGRPYGIGPGAPNYIERVESGLLSYRADTDDDTNPFEVGLGRWVDLDSDIDYIGKDALREIAANGSRNQLVGVRFEGDPVGVNQDLWPVMIDERQVGRIRAAAFSPRLQSNIATALLERPSAEPGTSVVVETDVGPRRGTVNQLPFLQ